MIIHPSFNSFDISEVLKLNLMGDFMIRSYSKEPIGTIVFAASRFCAITVTSSDEDSFVKIRMVRI